jgi:hypothetical protein
LLLAFRQLFCDCSKHTEARTGVSTRGVGWIRVKYEPFEPPCR